MLSVRRLPNKNVAGTFSPFDQIIRLDGFTRPGVTQIMQTTDHLVKWEKLFPLFRTLFHEYTHFLDMTTTTYGLSVMSDIYSGAASYSAGKNSINDVGASAARAAITESQKDEIHAEITGSYRKTWGYKDWCDTAKTDVGAAPHTLTGTIFLNPETLEVIAKIPFSIPSIFESNALANELFLCFVYCQSKSASEVARAKLQEQLNEEYLALIYNEEYAIYSVCFHRCANLIKTADIIHASRLSALICDICLNVAPTTMANLSPPESTLASLAPEFRARVIKEIQLGSRPLLFFMLTSLLPQIAFGIEHENALRNELIKRAGMTNFDSEAASAKLGLIKFLDRRTVKNPQYANLLDIVKKNIEVKKRLAIYVFHDYELPAVLLGDGEVLNLVQIFQKNQVGNLFDPAEHADWMVQYQDWL